MPLSPERLRPRDAEKPPRTEGSQSARPFLLRLPEVDLGFDSSGVISQPCKKMAKPPDFSEPCPVSLPGTEP